MRISVTGNNHLQSGLTLIEVLVVMALLGLVAGVTLLSLPPEISATERTAKSLAQDIRLMRNVSISRQILIGLQDTPSGFAYHEYTGHDWLPVNISNRAVRSPVAEGVTVEIKPAALIEPGTIGGDKFSKIAEISSEPEPSLPSVLFYPTGEVTPFSVKVSGRGKTRSVEVTQKAVIILEGRK